MSNLKIPLLVLLTAVAVSACPPPTPAFRAPDPVALTSAAAGPRLQIDRVN